MNAPPPGVAYANPAHDSALSKVAEQVGHAVGTAERLFRAAIGQGVSPMATDLAAFAARASYEHLTPAVVDALKIRVLDSLACACGALDGPPVRALGEQMDDFGAGRGATLIAGGEAAPDRAACYNTALVRYLDFMDNFMATGETCHPSDNFAGVLAAAEYANAHGRDFLTSLAVAYQVQCRLVELAPITEQGFDHTTQLAYSVAAGAGRALGLDAHTIANALGMAGAVSNTLWVTRTGGVSQWKGLQSAAVAGAATHHTFLAMRGVTGPIDVFDGVKGFMESIAGSFRVNWQAEDLGAVLRTSVKRYNAEVHSQSAIEGVLDLHREHRFDPDNIEQIRIEIFDEAVEIIGGGEAGARQADVEHKEEADHSLPYAVSVAILDGDVWPDQYRQERIVRDDVQRLLRRVSVRPHSIVPGLRSKWLDTYSWRYPDEMPCLITVTMRDGRKVTKEKRDYLGFYKRPLSWDWVAQKFRRLTAEAPVDADRIIDIVSRLDRVNVRELTAPLRVE